MTPVTPKIVHLPSAPKQVIKRRRKATNFNRGPLGDLENFSLMRWLAANDQARTTSTPARNFAKYEAAWYAKAQRETIGQDGGFLAPEEWRNDFFRVLRGGLILNKLEIQLFSTNARVSHVPWGTSDWNFNYVGENTQILAADRGLAQTNFTFKKASALSNVPRELIQDAPDLADEWLKNDGASAIAHEIDRRSLFGDGLAGRPLGLVNQSFVNTVSLFNDTGNGATPIYNDITSGIAQIALLGNTALITGGAAECNGVVAHPRFGQTLDNIQSPAGIPIWQYGLSNDKDMPSQPRWLGIRNWVLSALVPVNITVGSNIDCSQIIFGDWRNFILIVRQDFEFDMTDETTNFANNQYQVRIKTRYDAQAIFPFSFAVANGVRQ